MTERSVRETYDLPKKPPVPHRHWIAMLAVVAGVLLLWLVLPKSAVGVAILAVVTLVAVFFLVQRVLSSRELHRPPGRNPVRPRA